MSRRHLVPLALLLLSPLACGQTGAGDDAFTSAFSTAAPTTTGESQTTSPETSTSDDSDTLPDGDGDGDPTSESTGDGDGDPTSAGPACGNGVVEDSEQCDGNDLGGSSCESLGFAGGTLMCTDNCTLDSSGCINEGGAVCGDGQLEGSEQCDGNDLGGETCMSLGFDMGQLACDQNCGFDTSGCSNQGGVCGDNIVDPGEDCDGNNLDGESCQSQGFDAGVLACTLNCIFDTSGCMNDGGGGPCTFDADCPGDQVCVDQQCWDGNEGDPCVFDSDCVDGLYCEDACYDGSLGDPCTFDSDCESDICLIVQDICSAGNPGDPCTFNSECINSCQNNLCT